MDKSRCGVLAVLMLFGGLSLTACGGASSATPAQKIADFSTLTTTVKSDLASCTASVQDALSAVGLVIQAGSNVSETDLIDLDSISKNAQTACDDSKDQGLVSLGTLSIPGSLSGLGDLGQAPIEAETWASDDCDAVLHDIQNIAESSGSDVGVASQLQTDEATADSDSAAVQAAFNQAAATIGASNPSLGLVTFGS